MACRVARALGVLPQLEIDDLARREGKSWSRRQKVDLPINDVFGSRLFEGEVLSFIAQLCLHSTPALEKLC